MSERGAGMVFVLKYWKYIAVLGLVLSLWGALLFYGHIQYKKGEAVCTAKYEAEKQEAINENIKIRKKQDSAIRPDTDAYIERLRDKGRSI